jgi:hypothetical protein
MSPLIDFYRGTGTDARGRTLAQIWGFRDNEMEYHHDFIQWLFPLREPSQFNPDAPVLTEDDIQTFRGDLSLRDNLLRSFDRFLAFLGLAREGERIDPGPDFERKSWLFTSPNHNWLRITHVLHCLRLLGLEDQGQAFLDCLLRLVESGQARITGDTLAYWQNATFPDQPAQG